MPRFFYRVRSSVLSAVIGGLLIFASDTASAAVEFISSDDIVSAFQGESADIVDALNRGDTATARAKLTAMKVGPEGRFLEARLLSDEGKFSEAAAAYLALISDYPILSDYWLLRAVKLYESAERWDEALATMDKISASSPYGVSPDLSRAQIFEKKGDLKSARVAYAKVKGAQGLQGRLRMLELGASTESSSEERRRMEEERRRILVKLWREFPTVDLTEKQERELFPDGAPDLQIKSEKSSEKVGESVAKNKGAFLDGVTLEDAVARGEKLLSLHHNRKAISLLTPLMQAEANWKSGDLECRIRFAIGDGYRKERRHEDAIRILTPVVEKCSQQKERALYALASSQSIAHPERGPQFYDRYIREFPQSKKLDQAEWFAADLEIKNGQIEAVTRRLERLVKVYPKSRYAPEALFKMFWIHWTEKDRHLSPNSKAIDALSMKKRSEAWLQKIEEGWSGNLEERIRAEYWRGRLMLDAGDRASAIRLWKVLALSAPQRFYGVLALMELQRLDETIACDVKRTVAQAILEKSQGTSNPGDHLESQGAGHGSEREVRPPMDAAQRDILALLPRKIGGMKSDMRLAMALQFIRFGLTDEAKTLLNQMAKGKLDRNDRMTVAILLGLVGDLRSAQVIARIYFASVFEKPISKEAKGVWLLAWPRAHRALIEKYCPTKKVDPDQLQALMREESALDSKARSWAGALGLTQMMPMRAKEVAKMDGLVEFKEEALFQPEVAIRLGCAWLGKLLGDFNGERMHAYAAYNADTKRVRKWNASISEGDLARFVEQIPIAETRNYVKRLVRSEATYRWLYGAENMTNCGT